MSATPQPVVIAYGLAGIGHRRAAEALADALRANGHPAVHVVDVLEYMPAWFRWLYPRLYLLCIHHLPLLWAVSFYLTDRPWVERLTGPLRRWNNRRMARRFLRWLTALRPAALICTHFLPSEIVAPWTPRHLPSLRVWNVVTDYRPHPWWIAPGIDRYFVGLEETRDAFVARGVPAARITISGIPVDAAFHRAADRSALRIQHQRELHRTALLVTSGGYGVGPMQRLCRSLVRMATEAQDRIQLVVVAGDNPRLQARLTQWAAQVRFPIRIVGFTREMHELMAAADVVVTKPGGLTITEALVVGRPLVLFAPIWGQESGNAEILVHHGVARLLQRPEECGSLIEQWIRDPQALSAMRSQIAVMRRSSATDIIWSHLA